MQRAEHPAGSAVDHHGRLVLPRRRHPVAVAAEGRAAGPATSSHLRHQRSRWRCSTPGGGRRAPVVASRRPSALNARSPTGRLCAGKVRIRRPGGDIAKIDRAGASAERVASTPSGLSAAEPPLASNERTTREPITAWCKASCASGSGLSPDRRVVSIASSASNRLRSGSDCRLPDGRSVQARGRWRSWPRAPPGRCSALRPAVRRRRSPSRPVRTATSAAEPASGTPLGGRLAVPPARIGGSLLWRRSRLAFRYSRSSAPRRRGSRRQPTASAASSREPVSRKLGSRPEARHSTAERAMRRCCRRSSRASSIHSRRRPRRSGSPRAPPRRSAPGCPAHGRR